MEEHKKKDDLPGGYSLLLTTLNEFLNNPIKFICNSMKVSVSINSVS